MSAPLQSIEIDSCFKRRLQRSAKEGWGCYKPSWLSRVHWWLVPARNLSTFSTLTRQCMVTLPVVKMMSSQAMIVRGGMFVFFVLPPAVLPQFLGVPSWNVYCSRFGNRCGGRICLYVPSLPGFDNTREFCCCPKTKSKYLLVRSFFLTIFEETNKKREIPKTQKSELNVMAHLLLLVWY